MRGRPAWLVPAGVVPAGEGSARGQAAGGDCKGGRSCRGSARARQHRPPAKCRPRAAAPAARGGYPR
ncbi:hypothetical protein GW17_00062103 [Ensete ventricosum]|nr:hypothetical protein GW17_00062103 [Ensete ventricosum]